MSFNDVLNIQDFSLSFLMSGIPSFAVKNISLTVKKGEIVGLVGESGCGKTMTALSCIGLQPEDAALSGKIQICGENILDFSSSKWTDFRGKTVSMIFQEPMTSLNPVEKAGIQIAETGILHGLTKNQAEEKARMLMNELNLENSMLYHAYPHQLSGGQRQRIMIASALMNEPELLIADEPTTALDAATRFQIIKLLQKMNALFNTAILFVSHDLLLVKQLCSRIFIMYAGSILECGKTQEVLENPCHPYTKALLNAIPSFSKKNFPIETVSGFVPPVNCRSEDLSYLHERWPQVSQKCYAETSQLQTEHKVFCHKHKRLESV